MKSFYNAKAAHVPSKQDRAKSLIYPLRAFNNNVKRTLISLLGQENAWVMDICGGCGGDLAKWADTAPGRLVLLDSSDTSVREAQRRYEESRYTFPAVFEVADSLRLYDCEYPRAHFDLVSCQFAMNYLAESFDSLFAVLRGVAKFLKPGGLFFGTMPCADTIRKRGLVFGNNLYRITFPPNGGNTYEFWLAEAIDHVDEFLVDKEQLVHAAKVAGFRLRDPFKSFSEYSGYVQLGDAMKEVASLYYVLATAPRYRWIFVAREQAEHVYVLFGGEEETEAVVALLDEAFDSGHGSGLLAALDTHAPAGEAPWRPYYDTIVDMLGPAGIERVQNKSWADLLSGTVHETRTHVRMQL